MKIGNIELTYSINCVCGAEITGSTHKRAYLWLLWHATRSVKHVGNRPPFWKTLFALLFWKSR